MKSLPPLYQVADWRKRYENSKSMGYKRPQMACAPNHLSGPAWVNIVGEPDGAAINGIFDWIVKNCSQQECGDYHEAAGGGKPYFRSTRDGWLTADGTREGRRLAARELSFMFRRPIEEIHRALAVLASPEVALIKLIDGKSEFTGSEVADNEPALPVPAVTESVTMVTPRKLIEEKRTEQERKNPLSSVSAVTEVIQHAEAKALITELAGHAFDRIVSDADWRNPEKDHWLDQALPLTRQDWQALDWFYRLPTNHKGLETTARRQSLESFLEHLRSEIDKAKSLRKRLGLNGYSEANSGARPRQEWPPGGKEAAIKLYGPRDEWPEFFDQMPASTQSEILAQIGGTERQERVT
jgi:hypothetical protein